MTDTEIANDAEIEIDETEALIASNKVEGTIVYAENGEKLGSIYNFMVDKFSGQVEYAVLQFGGVFGLGSDYYPLPWEKLSYDVEQGGYVVDIDKETLEAAPRYTAEEEPVYDAAYGERIYGYYGLNYN
jgi:sporulation protein YlmC with PRC-barrel domain